MKMIEKEIQVKKIWDNKTYKLVESTTGDKFSDWKKVTDEMHEDGVYKITYTVKEIGDKEYKNLQSAEFIRDEAPIEKIEDKQTDFRGKLIADKIILADKIMKEVLDIDIRKNPEFARVFNCIILQI